MAIKDELADLYCVNYYCVIIKYTYCVKHPVRERFRILLAPTDSTIQHSRLREVGESDCRTRRIDC